MDKRAAILDATLNLLSKKGFHGFSIRDFAKESGVATGTVYIYFADRDDLIKQVYIQIVSDVANHLSLGADSKLSMQEEFANLSRQFWMLFQQKPEILLSKIQFDHLPPDVLRSHHQEAKSGLALLFDFFAKGVKSGELKKLPDEILFSLGFEPLFEISRKRLLGLIDVDNKMLENIIACSWAAIAR